jgi:4-nitrotryptophan synthase
MPSLSPLSDPAIIPDPFPAYAELSEREPVHWCEGLNAWAVLRHADCSAALKDPRLKAERMEEVLDAKFDGRVLPPDSIYHRFTKNVMMYTDPPLHDDLRRATNAGFTRAAHEHYSDVIKKVAADLVAEVPDAVREIDAVSALAAKLPVNAAVRAFGVPESDLGFVVPRVDTVMTFWSGPQDQPIGLDTLLEQLTELHVYALELLEGKRGKVPKDTVIDRLAAAQQRPTETELRQTVHQLVLLLIALFAPTTPGSVSSGMLSFARNPGQIARFRSDQACVDNTANEVVRYNASNQFTWEPLPRNWISVAYESSRARTSPSSSAPPTATRGSSHSRTCSTWTGPTAASTCPSASVCTRAWGGRSPPSRSSGSSSRCSPATRGSVSLANPNGTPIWSSAPCGCCRSRSADSPRPPTVSQGLESRET